MKKVKKYIIAGLIGASVILSGLCVYGYILSLPLINEVKENGYTRENIQKDSETYNQCAKTIQKMYEIIEEDEDGLEDIWLGGYNYSTSSDQFKLRVETLYILKNSLNNKKFTTSLYDGFAEEFNAIAETEIELYTAQSFDNDGYEMDIDKYNDKLGTMLDKLKKHLDDVSEHEEELAPYLK